MLDEYIVGQAHAKKVLSVAVYNHYKRISAREREASRSRGGGEDESFGELNASVTEERTMTSRWKSRTSYSVDRRGPGRRC